MIFIKKWYFIKKMWNLPHFTVEAVVQPKNCKKVVFSKNHHFWGVFWPEKQ